MHKCKLNRDFHRGLNRALRQNCNVTHKRDLKCATLLAIVRTAWSPARSTAESRLSLDLNCSLDFGPSLDRRLGLNPNLNPNPEALFESSMYTFVFMWTPELEEVRDRGWRGWALGEVRDRGWRGWALGLDINPRL